MNMTFVCLGKSLVCSALSLVLYPMERFQVYCILVTLLLDNVSGIKTLSAKSFRHFIHTLSQALLVLVDGCAFLSIKFRTISEWHYNHSFIMLLWYSTFLRLKVKIEKMDLIQLVRGTLSIHVVKDIPYVMT